MSSRWSRFTPEPDLRKAHLAPMFAGEKLL
jgi:hypothetical protein